MISRQQQPLTVPPVGEQQTIRTLQRMFRRNRWILIAAPLLTLLATLIFVRIATPVYEADLELRLDQERSNLAALEALQELSTGSEIQTELHELRTALMAAQVVDSLDLNVEVVQPKRIPRAAILSVIRADRSNQTVTYTLERVDRGTFRITGGGANRVVSIGEHVVQRGLSFTLAPAAAAQEEIVVRQKSFALAVATYQRKLVVSRPDREANVLVLRYESTDPLLAYIVPNAHAAQFIANRNEVRKTQARSTVDFLAAQIDTLGRQSRISEAALLAFQQRAEVINPEVEGQVQVSQLAELQAERDALAAERQSLAGILADIERAPVTRDPNVYRRLLFAPTLLKNPAVSELLRLLNELENRRTTLREQRLDTDPDVLVVTQRIRELDSELKSLGTTYLSGLNNSIASMDVVLLRFADQLSRIPAKELELARLRRQGKVTDELFTTLQVRLKEAQVAAAVVDPSVRVMDPAERPQKPIRPNVPFSLVLALMLGTALGAGIAFMREQLDTTIRNRDELQELSAGVPVLGQVPRIGQKNGRRSWLPFGNGVSAPAVNGSEGTRATPRGAVAEAYRTLRTNIAFTQPERPTKMLVITSALPGEGKSTSSSNLALTLSEQGLRVLLIDADMRRGRLHETLRTSSEPGLSNLLLGNTKLDNALQPLAVGGATMYFIPTGTLPPNPAELLASSRANILFDDLRKIFDAIIVDTPPLNVVTDGAIVGAQADGVVLVARSGVTERITYRHALEQLNAVHARVLGCLLNDVDLRGDAQYGRKGVADYYRSDRIPK